MADDPNKRGPADRTRINVNEVHEVKYWSDKFRCSPEELRRVVERVGVMAKDVEAALQKK